MGVRARTGRYKLMATKRDGPAIYVGHHCRDTSLLLTEERYYGSYLLTENANARVRGEAI